MYDHVRQICRDVERHLKDQKGQGLVEYALILILIAVVAIAVMSTLGTKVNSTFCNVTSQLSAH